MTDPQPSLVDVRDVLGAVRAPTLVLHRRDDIDARVEEGRYLADHIPGARFIELDGADHFVAVDPDQILDPVEEFVTGLQPAGSSSSTSLTTLLVANPVSSIDPGWVRGMLADLLREHQGTPAANDAAQVLATFDGPGRAVRCAVALVERASAASLEVTVGLHTAEVERLGASVAGSGVALARAVAEVASPGEVWVTSTLRDLLAGSGLSFAPRREIEAEGRRLELDAAS